jgi:exodeoxyribonuclease-3
MKLISWNVNGIRSALKKGFVEYVRKENPDIICLQETKAQQGQAEIDLPEYEEYWNSAQRKGYAGTAIFSKTKALSVSYGVQEKGKPLELKDKYGDANTEGRVITAEYEKFYVVTVYTPNSKPDLTRLDFRQNTWDPGFLDYLKRLEKKKPVLFCGDLNVAHEEIDLARPDTNHHAHGFTDEERAGFSKIIEAGFVDTFRSFHPGEGGHYSWWSTFGGARARNVGWRIDYWVVSGSIKNKIKEAFIRPEVMGSDHCPVGIVLDI